MATGWVVAAPALERAGDGVEVNAEHVEACAPRSIRDGDDGAHTQAQAQA